MKTKKGSAINMMRERIDTRDILQIVIGSLGGALVIAPTEEFHAISENIPWVKLIFLFVATLLFIGLIAYRIGVRTVTRQNMLTVWFFPIRIILIYCVSCFSCLFALWVYDLIIAGIPATLLVKKMIVLALPATTGGALIDLIGTKHR
jgi:uncharacterized membrane protein